jgi:hypothetical protein
MSAPSPAPAGPHARLFRFFAPLFVAAALFHAAALVKPAIAEPVPPWWHALFIVVNLVLAVGIVKRPRGFLLAFAVYTLQQLIEHGPRLIVVWRDDHRIDWGSVVAVVFVPFVLLLLVREAYPCAADGRGARAT